MTEGFPASIWAGEVFNDGVGRGMASAMEVARARVRVSVSGEKGKGREREAVNGVLVLQGAGRAWAGPRRGGMATPASHCGDRRRRRWFAKNPLALFSVFTNRSNSKL